MSQPPAVNSVQDNQNAFQQFCDLYDEGMDDLGTDETTAAGDRDDFPIDGAGPLWWRIGIDSFRERPIKGFGIGSAEKLITNDERIQAVTESGTKNLYVTRDDFHSSYITIIAESGGIGALMFLAWAGCVTRSCLRRNELATVLAASFTALVIFQVFNTTFFSGRLVALIAFVTTLALNHDSKAEE